MQSAALENWVSLEVLMAFQNQLARLLDLKGFSDLGRNFCTH